MRTIFVLALGSMKPSKESKGAGMGPTESTQLKELLAHLSGRLDEFNDKVGPVVQIFKDMRNVDKWHLLVLHYSTTRYKSDTFNRE